MIRICLCITAVGLLASLAACRSVEQKPISLNGVDRVLADKKIPAGAERLALARLQTARLLDGDQVTIDTRDGITFEEAFAIALVCSPRLEEVRAQSNAARDLALSVSGISSIAVSAGDDGLKDSRRYYVGTSVDLWSLFSSERREAPVDLYRAEHRSVIARLHGIEWEIFSDLTESFSQLGSVQKFKRELRLLRSRHRSSWLSLVETMFELGVASQLELDDARILANRIELRIEALDEEEASVVTRVKELLGFLPGWTAEPVVEPMFTLAPEALEISEMSETALKRRWDLQGMLAEYEGAEARIRLAVSEQYPSIRLGPNFRFGDGGSVFGGALDLELPNPSRTDAAIRSAEHLRSEIRARIEQRLVGIESGIDRAKRRCERIREEEGRWNSDVITPIRKRTSGLIRQTQLKRNGVGSVNGSFADEFEAVVQRWELNRELAISRAELQRMAGYRLSGEGK